MDLRQFRYFIAVAEELHFTRAAQRLNIGQPPLSLHIQAIEREVGVELLKRSRRRVELTEAGQQFLIEARAALTQADHAVDAARRAARGEIGRLNVRFTPSGPFTRVFTRAIRAFRLALPNVHLELRLSTSARILDALRAGETDIGVIRPAANAVLPQGIAAVAMTRDRFMLALHAGHPLAGGRRPVALRSLADDRFVLRPRGPEAAFFEQVFELCAQAGFTPKVVQEAVEASTILGLVAAGVGISILPASFRAIQMEGVVWRALAATADITNPVLLVFNGKAREMPQRTRFIEIVRRLGRDVDVTPVPEARRRQSH
jgi:DNA-binding transcriptional LysR family regulator